MDSNITTEALSLSPALKDFISGAVAGAFAITVSQPLDTVRVRLQQSVSTSGPKQKTMSLLLAMIRQEGLLSPWKGLTYPLLFASVQSAILFQAYGWAMRQLTIGPEQPPQSQPQPQPRPPQQAHIRISHQPDPASLTPAWLPAAAAAAHPSPHMSLLASPLAPPHLLQSHQTPHPNHHLSQPHPHDPSSSRSGAAASPEPPSAPHPLHLHHHHHLQEGHQAAVVHGPGSVTGRLLAEAAASWAGLLGLRPQEGLQLGRWALGGVFAEPVGGPQQREQGETAQLPGSSSGGSSCTSGAEGGSTGGCLATGSSRGELVTATPGAFPACVEAGGGSGSSGCGRQTEQQLAGSPKTWHGLAAGGVAGFAQVFLWSPVELLKLRSQLQTAPPGAPGYRNPAALAAQVLRQEGVVGLYRGFTLTLVRDVPSFAAYFWLYHDIASALSPGVHPEEAPPATQVVAGGLAGVIAWMTIYPLDVLKTRVQAEPGGGSSGGGSRGNRTWLHFARELYGEAGYRAFFRGLSPTLLRAFLMDGASFLGYSTTLKLLGGGGGGAVHSK